MHRTWDHTLISHTGCLHALFGDRLFERIFVLFSNARVYSSNIHYNLHVRTNAFAYYISFTGTIEQHRWLWHLSRLCFRLRSLRKVEPRRCDCCCCHRRRRVVDDQQFSFTGMILVRLVIGSSACAWCRRAETISISAHGCEPFRILFAVENSRWMSLCRRGPAATAEANKTFPKFRGHNGI